MPLIAKKSKVVVKGKEFLNAMFQHMLMDNDIHWYNTENKDIIIMAGVVERVNCMDNQDVAQFYLEKQPTLY